MACLASVLLWFARIPTTPSLFHLICVAGAPSSPSPSSLLATILAAPTLFIYFASPELHPHHRTTARAEAALWREAPKRLRRRMSCAQPHASVLREGALSPGAWREVAVDPYWPSPPSVGTGYGFTFYRFTLEHLVSSPRVPARPLRRQPRRRLRLGFDQLFYVRQILDLPWTLQRLR
jgi:hypothetical protein